MNLCSCLSYFEQIILEAGVDVNITNAQNTTPLHVALNRGANSCVGLLLSAGADCNLQVIWLISIILLFSDEVHKDRLVPFY